MSLSPEQWEVFYDAAQIYAFSAQSQPEDRARVMNCLAIARIRGATAQQYSERQLVRFVSR